MEDLQQGRRHLRVIKRKSRNKWPSSGGDTANAALKSTYCKWDEAKLQFVYVNLKLLQYPWWQEMALLVTLPVPNVIYLF